MLNPMWMRLACRKPEVTMRHHSPSATPISFPLLELARGR